MERNAGKHHGEMGAASLGLEGDALAWFQWENKR